MIHVKSSRTSKEYNCARLWASDFVHDCDRVEGIVGQAYENALFLSKDGSIGAHIWGYPRSRLTHAFVNVIRPPLKGVFYVSSTVQQFRCISSPCSSSTTLRHMQVPTIQTRQACQRRVRIEVASRSLGPIQLLIPSSLTLAFHTTDVDLSLPE